MFFWTTLIKGTEVQCRKRILLFEKSTFVQILMYGLFSKQNLWIAFNSRHYFQLAGAHRFFTRLFPGKLTKDGHYRSTEDSNMFSVQNQSFVLPIIRFWRKCWEKFGQNKNACIPKISFLFLEFFNCIHEFGLYRIIWDTLYNYHSWIDSRCECKQCT